MSLRKYICSRSRIFQNVIFGLLTPISIFIVLFTFVKVFVHLSRSSSFVEPSISLLFVRSYEPGDPGPLFRLALLCIHSSRCSVSRNIWCTNPSLKPTVEFRSHFVNSPRFVLSGYYSGCRRISHYHNRVKLILWS